MMSINEQIGMPIVGKGQSIYQPALYGNIGLDEITSLREPRAVVVGTAYWQNAQGIKEETADSWGLNSTWSGCNSCGSFSSATGDGQYNCKQRCESLFTRSGEKALREQCKDLCNANCKVFNCKGFVPSRATICLNAGKNSDCTEKLVVVGEDKGGNVYGAGTSGTETGAGGSEAGTGLGTIGAGSGMSSNVKIGLAVGGVAVLGLIIFLARRK